MNHNHEHKKRVDTASLVILGITLALFLIALYEKGLTQEILLEAGVFLVSVKLILTSVKNDLANQSIEEKLDRLIACMDRTQKESEEGDEKFRKLS